MASTIITLAVLATVGFTTRIVILFPTHYKVVEQYIYKVGAGFGEAHVSQMKWDIHSTLYQYRWIDGQKYLIYSYGHAAALTVISENMTAGKLTGDVFPVAAYLNNVTYISVGTDVGLSTASTQLPGEWNRSTSLTPEYIAVGQWNLSYSFYPSGSGTTNSTGLNWASSGDGNLWAYDTFSDIDYTSNDQIDVEWSIDIQYS